MIIIRDRAAVAQIDQMREPFEDYIKVAVDVERRILAGGGKLHADCEATLLEDGSLQQDLWGADWYPARQHIEFESFINIRPAQDNRTRFIADAEIRSRVESIVRELLESSDVE